MVSMGWCMVWCVGCQQQMQLVKKATAPRREEIYLVLTTANNKLFVAFMCVANGRDAYCVVRLLGKMRRAGCVIIFCTQAFLHCILEDNSLENHISSCFVKSLIFMQETSGCASKVMSEHCSDHQLVIKYIHILYWPYIRQLYECTFLLRSRASNSPLVVHRRPLFNFPLGPFDLAVK